MMGCPPHQSSMAYPLVVQVVLVPKILRAERQLHVSVEELGEPSEESTSDSKQHSKWHWQDVLICDTRRLAVPG